VAEEIKRGSIVLASLNDYHGKTSAHYAVVLTSSENIRHGSDLVVAGISTSFRHPLPPQWFALDTHPLGHPITGLKEACVVKADWIDIVRQDEVICVQGRALARTVKQILAYIQQNP
jgi:mRNA-degrading endonuclease toxin of MazEF toxin-antitoxin module